MANKEANFALAQTKGKGNRKRPRATQRPTKEGNHAHKATKPAFALILQ